MMIHNIAIGRTAQESETTLHINNAKYIFLLISPDHCASRGGSLLKFLSQH